MRRADCRVCVCTAAPDAAPDCGCQLRRRRSYHVPRVAGFVVRGRSPCPCSVAECDVHLLRWPSLRSRARIRVFSGPPSWRLEELQLIRFVRFSL